MRAGGFDGAQRAVIVWRGRRRRRRSKSESWSSACRCPAILGAQQLTGSVTPDAIGSILIGLLLVVVAVLLIDRNRQVLVGEEADPRARRGRSPGAARSRPRSTPPSPACSWAGNADAERLAARRMRPGYRPAFNAWLATDPAHNPSAPAGPAYMPQCVIPQEAVGQSNDAHADAAFANGADAGSTSDKYTATPCSWQPSYFCRNQQRLPNSPSAPGAHRNGSIAAGVRGDPAARPARTALLAPARRVPRRATGTALRWIETGRTGRPRRCAPPLGAGWPLGPSPLSPATGVRQPQVRKDHAGAAQVPHR